MTEQETKLNNVTNNIKDFLSKEINKIQEEQRNKSIATTIINQLPKGWRYMTGTKIIMAIKNGLAFRPGTNPEKISHIEIRLNSMDLYDVTTYKGKGIKMTKKETISGLYFDMLQKTLEQKTKLYFSL